MHRQCRRRWSTPTLYLNPTLTLTPTPTLSLHVTLTLITLTLPLTLGKGEEGKTTHNEPIFYWGGESRLKARGRPTREGKTTHNEPICILLSLDSAVCVLCVCVCVSKALLPKGNGRGVVPMGIGRPVGPDTEHTAVIPCLA